MSWAVGYDENWHRDIGYGVPAYCDHPGCRARIDRGLANVCCGEQPYGGERGCGLFFCEKHHSYYRVGSHGLCARCFRSRVPFTPTPDHPVWLYHKLTDPTWAEWRSKHMTECADIVRQLPTVHLKVILRRFFRGACR